MWTWLLVTSMVLRGDATTATILASLRRPLLTALCRCLQAPHHCGDPDRSLATVLTCVGLLNRLNPTDSGRYGFIATTKHGSTSTVSDGMIYNTSVRNLVKGFS